MILDNIRKYPSIFTALLFVTGILIAYFVQASIADSEHAYLLVAEILLIMAALIFYARLQPHFSNNRLWITYLSLILAFGAARYMQHTHDSENRDFEQFLNEHLGTEASIFGSVIEQPEIANDRIRVLLESDSIITDKKKINSDVKILCSIYRNKYRESFPDRLKFGDAVSIQGKLQDLPHKRNPGEFDYGRYLKVHGIDGIVTSYGFDNVKFFGHPDQDFYMEHILYPVKIYCIETIDNFVPGNEGEFLKGIVIGDRSGISKQAREDFVNAGVAHIIAVSGLNVAYVLICVSFLLTFIPVRYKYKIFILIVFLFFYMNLTGNVPSIVRAVIMASVFLLSRLLERKPNPYSVVSFAGLIILIADPEQILDPGFILSFSAVLSIILFYPRLEKMISKLGFYKKLKDDNILQKPARLILIYLLVTLSAFLGLLPITAVMFERVSLVSIITNLIVVPLSNIALAIGFLLILTSLVSAWLTAIIASAASLVLYFLLWFINYSAGFDFSYVETYGFNILLFISYYLFLFILFGINRVNLKAKFALVILLIANFLLFDSVLYKSEDLRLTYFDVGKSNSTLISVRDKFNVLINAGSSGINYTSSERTVIPYLKRQRIGSIDLLIITDLDFSEYRNLIYLAVNFPVSKIVLPSYYIGLFEGNFLKRVFKNTRIAFADTALILDSLEGMRLHIRGKHIDCLYGRNSFVFSGGEDVPTGMRADILRASNSGSFDKDSPSFIAELNPRVVIISTVSGRRGRQSEIFLNTLKSVGIEVLNVGEMGAAVFESDGETVRQIHW